MKKLFLFGVLAGSISFADAQNYSDWGTQIGRTYYDLQSNGASGNRIVRYPDGRIAATWTESCLSSPGTCDPGSGTAPPPGECVYADRGAGYNVLVNGTWEYGTDGTCDETGQSMYGIFPNRVGWPEIVVTGNGREIVFAHSPIQYVYRDAAEAGTGGPLTEWTHVATPFPSTVLGNTWPRAVASGNTIHMIATCNGCTDPVSGVTAPIRYYRSTDNGANWDKVDAELPDLDVATFPHGIGADAYAIHANGNNVAIIAGAGGNSWVMWKSEDNGDTWTKRVMRSFGGAADTIAVNNATYTGYYSNDRFMSVVVTNDGTVHAFAGEQAAAIDRVTLETTTSYFPGLSQGLWHWSSDFATGAQPEYITYELEDLTPDDTTDVVAPLISTYGNYQSGTIGMPSAAYDANGNVYVVFSAVVAGTATGSDTLTAQNFRNLYVASLSPGGSWGKPVNMAAVASGAGMPSEYEESVFPSVVKQVGSDNILHLIYQNDDEPGLHIQADYDLETNNRIVYAPFNVNLITGVKEDLASILGGIKVMPNPTAGKTNVKVELLKDAKVGVKVTNLLGQEVFNKPAADFFVNNNNIIELDMSAQPAGMYLVSVIVDGIAQTERLVKQ